MAGIQLPNYPEFVPIEEPSVAVMWEDWYDGFDSLMGAMEITDKKKKYLKFKHYIGVKTRKILSKLPENGSGDQDFEKAVKALKDKFCPKMNRTFLMHSLCQLKQEVSESMDSFHMRVLEKMNLLDLDTLTVKEIIELLTLAQLVNNTHDSALRKKALKDGLKLQAFLDHARAHERAEHQVKEIERSEAISFVKHQKYQASSQAKTQ